VKLSVLPVHLAIVGRQTEIVKQILEFSERDAAHVQVAWNMLKEKVGVAFM
jgi:hypothetical protein